jgi:multicomponent Na+:H+ antiporter subunit F
MTGVHYGTIVLLALGGVIGTVALLRARVTVEKMAALDMLTTLITGLLLVVSLIFDKAFILDIAIVYAILSFGAVVVVARYREGGV